MVCWISVVSFFTADSMEAMLWINDAGTVFLGLLCPL